MTYILTRDRLAPLNDNPYPLGRHVNHDSRSRAYPFTATGSVALSSVRHARHVPVWDQGALGSCTGNAALGCLGTGGFYAALRAKLKWVESEAVSLYSDATRLDGYDGTYPPDDTGSDGLSVAKAVLADGLISGYRHAFTFNDATAALLAGPVITGIPWYQSMFATDAAGNVDVDFDSRLSGGHEFVVDEIDAPGGRIGFTNSWGTGWGAAGRGYLTFAEWQELLQHDGDVTVFTPITDGSPEPVPVPADADLADLVAGTKKFRSSVGWSGYRQAKAALTKYLAIKA